MILAGVFSGTSPRRSFRGEEAGDDFFSARCCLRHSRTLRWPAPRGLVEAEQCVAQPGGRVGARTATGERARSSSSLRLPRLVLFDRDGTLLHDVPYNGNPDRVEPVPGAAEALGRLRERGIATGIVSNQSGVARGLLTRDDVEAVGARIDQLLGPFDTWQYCPHAADDGCGCRKPAPGMVLAAAAEVGVPPREC